jgi:hypothetical protein
MPRTISISIPHDLTEDEVKRRLVTGIADARAKYPTVLKSATESWSGNQMTFRAAALGQTITGRVDVQPKTVVLSIDLPAMLAMLASKIRPMIEQEGRELLEKKT